MALCTYSSDTHSGSFLVIDNNFINEYLPLAPPQCVKVYIYGLYLCSNPSAIENSIESFSHILSMDISEIRDAFEYWQGEGLVQILDNENTSETSIKFLPVSRRSGSSKKRTNKYGDFNSKIQAIIQERMITPSEFNEYYTMIESYHFDEEALLMIAQYCVNIKGTKVNYPYIIAVAKNFANEGCTTTETVKEKLDEHNEVQTEATDILKALGKRYQANIEMRELYIKWTTELGFDHGTIKDIAKEIKSKNGDLTRLDNTLSKYYRLKLLTTKEINEYNLSQEKYIQIAKEVTKNLGLRYDNLDAIIENYISEWVSKGYEQETLYMLSHFCFKRSIRTLEGMDSYIQKLYKLGLVSPEAIDQYISDILVNDSKIKTIFEKCNILRNVNSWDRDMYTTWTETWKLSDDVISVATEEAKDKVQPIQYLNKLLSSLYEAKVTTTEQAREHLKKSPFATSASTSAPKPQERKYEAKDFNSLFDELDNIVIK